MSGDVMNTSQSNARPGINIAEAIGELRIKQIEGVIEKRQPNVAQAATPRRMPSLPTANTPSFVLGLPTPNCISAAITYVNTKRLQRHESDDTTQENVVERLIEIVNARGFPYLKMESLHAHLGLLTSVGKVSATGKGKKLEIHHPDDYKYDDLSRITIFRMIELWTNIPVETLQSESLRSELAYDGATLVRNTKASEEKIGHLFFMNWEDGNERSPVSTCGADEIAFIVEIAIKRKSNIEKDKRFREFLQKYLENDVRVGEIISNKNPSDDDIAYINRLFPEKCKVQKRPCGICHICKFPIYIYRIVYVPTGANIQLNTCGEMEHVFPPGFGSMVGTISSRAKTMKQRLNTVSAVSEGGQRGGINKADLYKAEDVLVKFGLRASHAWCNKIKSDLIFLVISMLGLFIQGLEYDEARITAFKKEVTEILTKPDRQLTWNYELQFRSGHLEQETIDPLNQQHLYDVELKTPEAFAFNCGENIKALMTEFSEAAEKVNTANFQVIEGAEKAVATQIKLRTIMYSVIFWHDVLVNSENKSAAAYLAIWKNYQRGGKYKHKGGVNTVKLNDTLNTYITSMVGMITDTNKENVQSCTPQTGDNPFEEALDTMDDPRLLQMEIVQANTPGPSRAPALSRALSQVMTQTLSEEIGKATIPFPLGPPPTIIRILSERPSASASASSSASATAATASALGTPYIPPPNELFHGIPLRRSASHSIVRLSPQPPSLTRAASQGVPSQDVESVLGRRTANQLNLNNNHSTKKGKKGGTRKLRKPRNHCTRKQKKNRKTRKIKKLTKRF